MSFSFGADLGLPFVLEPEIFFVRAETEDLEVLCLTVKPCGEGKGGRGSALGVLSKHLSQFNAPFAPANDHHCHPDSAHA